MSFWKKIITINLLLISTLFSNLEFAKADAWWGEGAKDKDWVLEHGGSLIYYQIKGKAKSNKYTVKMFLEGEKGAGGNASDEAKEGDFIEIEYGSTAVLDDAINNEYKIKVYRSDEKQISTKINAKPGVRATVLFDLYEDDVIISEEVVYPKYQIKLNSESSKWIDPAQLRPPQKTVSEEEQEKIEKEKAQEELERERKIEKEKQEELKNNFNLLKEKVTLTNKKIEEDFSTQEKKTKNIFGYLVYGPEKKIIKKNDERINKNKKRIEDIKNIEEDFEEETIIKEERRTLQSSLKKQSPYLDKYKKDLNFWNRLKSVFNMS